MLPNDDRVREAQKQRHWARELARAFDPHPPSAGLSTGKSIQASSSEAMDSLTPRQKEALSEVSYVGHFQMRPAPRWMYVSIGIIVLKALVGVSFIFRGKALGLMVAVILLFDATLWSAGRHLKVPPPICPHCKENVTNCTVLFCYRCGKPVDAGICGACGVNESWAALDPSRPDGPISYCPGCGAWLDSNLRRWRPSSD